MSNNTQLIGLYCGSNQISSLDVSKNTELTSLECSGNQISSLDVSKNAELTSLGCSSNQISSLDVSKNTELTSLGCSSNQISSLDVSNNTQLTRLDCRSNQISSLDLSNNTKLTLTNYEYNKIMAPVYQLDDSYYIDLSEFPLNKELVCGTDMGSYNPVDGHISLDSPVEVGHTYSGYYYEVGLEGYALMLIEIEVSEIIKVEHSSSEQTTTEVSTESTDEQTTMEAPTESTGDTVTEAASGKMAAAQDTPKTGDAAIPYLVAIIGCAGAGALFVSKRK